MIALKVLLGNENTDLKYRDAASQFSSNDVNVTFYGNVNLIFRKLKVEWSSYEKVKLLITYVQKN